MLLQPVQLEPQSVVARSVASFCFLRLEPYEGVVLPGLSSQKSNLAFILSWHVGQAVG
jgi:hypothetical protein